MFLHGLFVLFWPAKAKSGAQQAVERGAQQGAKAKMEQFTRMFEESRVERAKAPRRIRVERAKLPGTNHEHFVQTWWFSTQQPLGNAAAEQCTPDHSR